MNPSMTELIDVQVKLFGPVRDIIGRDTLEYAVAQPATLSAVAEMLFARYPRLAASATSLRFAVNEEYADLATPLKAGDEIAVIPPVAGGQGYVTLTRDKLNSATIVAGLADPACGAVVTFEGVVRQDGSADHSLIALEYSAYESMALQEMRRLRDAAINQFAIQNAALVHRLGRMSIGETSVVIVVTAAHREDAFEACRWLIETLKRDVPIWKKEIWSQGEGTWVGAS
jgi:MoaE-MoaD fusion protein